ncbi:hypothetical protein ACJZ2D_007391 [Fusarium nematophilum]
MSPDLNAREKKTIRACDSCCRLKERCNGSNPCERCLKRGRTCLFTREIKRRGRPRALTKNLAPDSPIDPVCFFDVERIRALERIVLHLTGIESPSKENLEDALASLQSSSGTSPMSSGVPVQQLPKEPALEALPAATIHQESESLSHTEFSHRLQEKVENQLGRIPYSRTWRSTTCDETPLSTQLLSHGGAVSESVSLFPSQEVALSLVDVFFDFAQLNCFYVDEDFLRSRLSEFYGVSPLLTIQDAPWVCIVLMVFAIGSQFSHLKAVRQFHGQTMGEISLDDALAVTYFVQASKLIPDIVVLASVECVQALLLLGLYVLPLDHAGPSSTFFAMAVQVAMRNGMHRDDGKHSVSRQSELRRRVWWTAYAMDRRIAIFQGRPTFNRFLITPSSASAVTLTNGFKLASSGRVDSPQNLAAMVKLTDMLEDARDTMFDLKHVDVSRRVEKIQHAIRLRNELCIYWQGLPDDIHCKDLGPDRPLSRRNIYLALHYHIIHIFIGRTFLLDHFGPSLEPPLPQRDLEIDLVRSCIQNAIAMIELCQSMENRVGVSRSSYFEFTSCQAAVSVLVAESIASRTVKWKGIIKQGLDLLKLMVVGIFAQDAQKRLLETLERAVNELLDSYEQGDKFSSDDKRYEEFLKWATTQQDNTGAMFLSSTQQDNMLPMPGVVASSSGNAIGWPVLSMGVSASPPSGMDRTV